MHKEETGFMTKQDKFDFDMAKTAILMKSNLQSLNGVGVVPPGELTTIIGPRGNGKSSFIKTILVEACAQNVKTLIILSEEKVLSYKAPVAEIVSQLKDKETSDRKLGHLTFTAMMNWADHQKDIGSMMIYLNKKIAEKNIELVIFDNFTTSPFGQLQPDGQGKAIEKLRKLASDNNIGVLVVFHTIKGADPHNRLLDGDDVRGNATSTNTAAYNYVLTTYFKCDPPRSFLHIDKARYHARSNKTYWELKYDYDLGIYTKDVKVSANLMEALIKHLKQQSKDIILTNNFK